MIERLIHIVQRKNDINRRRRRFYYYWTGAAPRNRAFKSSKVTHHISETEAMLGYRKAQSDIKEMKSIVSLMRRELSAKFIWNAGGMITHIVYEGVRIHHREFKRISNEYIAERILLEGL